MEEKKYDINGKTYIQRPLVLGQVRQLLEVLPEVHIPRSPDVMAFAGALVAQGAELSKLLAIVLIPEGVEVRDKDLSALAEELTEYHVTPGQVTEIIDDFFGLNPLSSVMDRITAAMERINGTAIPSASSVSSSPAETSPSETESSGDTP